MAELDEDLRGERDQRGNIVLQFFYKLAYVSLRTLLAESDLALQLIHSHGDVSKCPARLRVQLDVERLNNIEQLKLLNRSPLNRRHAEAS